MRTAAALLALCLHAASAAAGGGGGGSQGNVVHLAMPGGRLMVQDVWSHAHDAHALIVPVLLDFQPVLLRLRSDQSIGAQLRWFCVQHGLDPGRCGVVLQQAIEELMELRGAVYCKRSAQSPPALLTVRNILTPVSKSLYAPTYAWLHDEAINMASDLCGFLQSSMGQDFDANGCESALQEAFDESFKWVSALPLCESSSVHAVDEQRISTIEQMIESLVLKDSGILNIVTTDIAGHDQTRMADTSQYVAPLIAVIASEEQEHPSDELTIQENSLSDRISTIEQMIASLQHSENTIHDDNTVRIQEQEDAMTDNTDIEADANQADAIVDPIGQNKAEESIFTEASQSVQMIACHGNCSHETGIFFPESSEENADSSRLLTDSCPVSENKARLQAKGDEDMEMESNDMPARDGEPIDTENASSFIQNIKESVAAITAEMASFLRHTATAIRAESSAPWTLMLTLTLLLFIFYLVLDLLSIGIHHLADIRARQAFKLNIAFIGGRTAASVFPETASTKAQRIAVVHPADSKLVNDATSPPADAAGAISAKSQNVIRPASTGNEQRKALLLRKVTKTYRRRTQKTAMGLWRSASALNTEPKYEPEEAQAVTLEPTTQVQPIPDPQSQDTISQSTSQAPSFTCAAMTLLFAHHAQYHLPVAKANTTSELDTCETPALIHSVSVQDIRQLSATLVIQCAWRAKLKLLRGRSARNSQIAESRPSRRLQEKLQRQLPIFQLLHHSRAKRNDHSDPSLDATWTVPESDEFFSRIESPPQKAAT